MIVGRAYGYFLICERNARAIATLSFFFVFGFAPCFSTPSFTSAALRLCALLRRRAHRWTYAVSSSGDIVVTSFSSSSSKGKSFIETGCGDESVDIVEVDIGNDGVEHCVGRASDVEGGFVWQGCGETGDRGSGW